jgi:hypothetical protein
MEQDFLREVPLLGQETHCYGWQKFIAVIKKPPHCILL